ncbi:MAG: DUF881 domain-containing protein [Pseudonocardiales bacterium]
MTAAPPAGERRVGSGLLRDLLEQHLESGYLAAARRRAEHPPSAHRQLQRAMRLVVLVALGLLFATTYVQASASAPQAARTRAALANDARTRAALTDRLQRQATAERTRLSAQRAQALRSTAAGSQAAAALQDVEGAAALTAVAGGGLVVTVGDAARSNDPVTGDPDPGDPAAAGRLQDRDVAEIVNALWAAGAEAVSVDGQRLSPTSTIRSAGGAILVDFRPVSSPYEVRAIGNAGLMQVRFTDSATARAFFSFIDLYRITFSVRRVSAITVPAASGTILRYAAPGLRP